MKPKPLDALSQRDEMIFDLREDLRKTRSRLLESERELGRTLSLLKLTHAQRDALARALLRVLDEEGAGCGVCLKMEKPLCVYCEAELALAPVSGIRVEQ